MLPGLRVHTRRSQAQKSSWNAQSDAGGYIHAQRVGVERRRGVARLHQLQVLPSFIHRHLVFGRHMGVSLSNIFI